MTYIPRYKQEIRKGTGITQTVFRTFEKRVRQIAELKSENGEMLITPLASEETHSRLVANYFLNTHDLPAFRNARIKIDVENAIGDQKQFGPLNATMVLVLENMNSNLTSILRIIVENLGDKSHIVDSSNSYMADLVFDRDLDMRNGPLSFDVRDFQAAGQLISNFHINRYGNLLSKLRNAVAKSNVEPREIIDFQLDKNLLVGFLSQELSFKYIMDI